MLALPLGTETRPAWPVLLATTAAGLGLLEAADRVIERSGWRWPALFDEPRWLRPSLRHPWVASDYWRPMGSIGPC